MKATCRLMFRVLACAVLAAAAHAADVTFKTVSAADTGIRPILEKWCADELASHGGKKPSHWWWPWGLTALDFDRDGDLDLLPTHHGIPGGLVLKNLLRETGKLTFVNATESLGLRGRELPGAIGYRTVVYDFNGDGWLDFFGIRSPHYLNRDGRRFEPFGKGPDTLHPREIVDVNGDGYPDLKLRGGLEAWVFTPDPPGFKQVALPPPPVLANVPDDVKQMLDEVKKKTNNRFFTVVYETEHDLNGDGLADVVVVGQGAYGGDVLGRYLTADAAGRLTDVTGASGLPTEGAPILIHDLTGDGALDILVATGKDAGLYVNDGRGRFAVKEGELKKFLEKRGPYLLRAWTVDFDNDRDPDLVVSNPRLGDEQVFENQGGGTFKRVLKVGGWDSDPIVICDINDDGLMDLVIGGPGQHQSTEITVYLNATPNPGNFTKLYPRMDAPNPYAVGTVVEVFAAGDLGKPDARPYLVEKAHPDATPIHVGLADAATFDFRVTFPGTKPLELKNIAAKPKLTVSAAGLK